MNILRDNSYDQSMKILLCPKCMNKIPFMSTEIIDENIILHIACNCDIKEQIISLSQYLNIISNKLPKTSKCAIHNDRKANKYCIQCTTWVCQECLNSHNIMGTMHHNNNNTHLILQREIYFKCIKHEVPNINHCKNCQVDYCTKCNEEHKNHSIKKIIPFDSNDLIEKTKKIEEILQSNIQAKEYFISKLDDNMIMKKEIELAYLKYDKNNQQLKELLTIIFNTVLLTRESPNYALNKILQNINIDHALIPFNFNQEDNKKMNDSIRKSYMKLIDYLKTNLIMNIKGNSKTTLKEDSFNHKKSHFSSKNKIVATLKGHKSLIPCLIQLIDGNLASSSWDWKIKLWNLTTYKKITSLKGHFNWVNYLLQLKDGRLVSCSYDSTIRIWGISTYQQITVIDDNCPIILIIQLCNNNICSYLFSKEIVIRDIKSFNSLIKIKTPLQDIKRLIQLFDSTIASCCNDSIIQLWNSSSFKPIGKIERHQGHINNMIQLLDGRLALCMEKNQTIQLWEMKACKDIIELIGHKEQVNCIIELKNGRLVSGSNDRTIKSWCMKTYKCLLTYNESKCNIFSLLQLEDGKLAIGGDVNNSVIHIWDLNNKL